MRRSAVKIVLIALFIALGSWALPVADAEASSCLTRNNLTALPNGSLAPVLCNQYGQLYAVSVQDDGTQQAGAAPQSLIIPVRYESPYLHRTAGSSGLTCTTSSTPVTYPIGQAVPLACNQYGQLLVELSGVGAGAVIEATVAELPATPDSGTIRIVTDGDSASDCTVGGGSTRVLCNFDGSSWAGLSGGISGWPTTSTTKEITWANSLANAVRIGDGVTPLCLYTDATLGPVVIPCTASNTTTLALTNFTWSLWDQEGATAIMTADPDSIGAGSGTLNMQTSYQFGASNLGIEFAESDTNPACAAGNYNIYADTSETQLKKCVNGTASVLSGAVIVRKASDETLGNSTTKQADDELLFPIATSGTYRFTMYALIQGPAAGDFKFDFSGPAGATGSYSAVYFPAAVTACNAGNAAQLRSPPLGSEMSAGTEADGVNCPLQVSGVVVAGGTAGNVTFNWAKLAADAGTTRVMANSYLIWEKL